MFVISQDIRVLRAYKAYSSSWTSIVLELHHHLQKKRSGLDKRLKGALLFLHEMRKRDPLKMPHPKVGKSVIEFNQRDTTPLQAQLLHTVYYIPRAPGLEINPTNIRIWIHEKDLGNLERVVWEGHGHLLTSQTSSHSKIRKFIEATPKLMVRLRAWLCETLFVMHVDDKLSQIERRKAKSRISEAESWRLRLSLKLQCCGKS